MELFSDRSEKIAYHHPTYGVWSAQRKCSEALEEPSHWHEEIQLLFVLSGAMLYQVNGEGLRLTAGSGIFINRFQLHSGVSCAAEDSEYLYVLIHPASLMPSPELAKEYVLPVLTQGPAYMALASSQPWQKEILHDMQSIHTYCNVPGAPPNTAAIGKAATALC